MTKKTKKKVPRFRSEEEEREFWQDRDSSDYIDWESGKRVNLVEPDAISERTEEELDSG